MSPTTAHLLALPLALALAACGSSVSSSDDGEATGSGGAGGGESTSSGSGGEDEGCEGEPLGDCPGGVACVEGAWVCEPCTPDTCIHECPGLEPTPGAPCPAQSEGESCDYEAVGDCAQGVIRYTCEYGVWSEGVYSYCSPLVCRDLADPDACEASGCRWLEPGCGDDPIPLPAAGCFDVGDCVEGSCWGGDEICMPVSVEPACADEGCDACGETAVVCVPQLVGE